MEWKTIAYTAHQFFPFTANKIKKNSMHVFGQKFLMRFFPVDSMMLH